MLILAIVYQKGKSVFLTKPFYRSAILHRGARKDP